ncbi:MAG TPA: hypothetical protein VFN54_02800 [Acidimicrobiales bacterium]|nr:hypothetical protein [Acidimicrobiales bacterium]
MISNQPPGALDLSWNNKHLQLLARDEGSYEWIEPSDCRTSEKNAARLYQGRCYHPDFAAEAADDTVWLVETKADRDLQDDDFVARGAAEEWARYVSDHQMHRQWRCLFLGESNSTNAIDDWKLLLIQTGNS